MLGDRPPDIALNMTDITFIKSSYDRYIGHYLDFPLRHDI